jgi:hypothetical protein
MEHAPATNDDCEPCLGQSPLATIAPTNCFSHQFDISAKFPSGFSLTLIQRLQSSRTKIDAFIDSTMCRVDDVGKENAKLVREKQNEIEKLIRTLNQVKLQRGVLIATEAEDDPSLKGDGGIAARRKALEETRGKLQQSIHQMNQQIQSAQNDLGALLQEKEKCLKEVNVVREKKRAVELQKDTRIEDLTKGVMLYKLLGLDFEKKDDDLWFRFTHLDPREPLRQFSFALTMVNGDTYKVNRCDPDLPHHSVSEIVQQLNEANNAQTAIAAFVRSMRKAFQNHYTKK